MAKKTRKIKKPQLVEEIEGEEARGPRRIRRVLQRQAKSLENALLSIAQAVERNGRASVDEALGDSAAELPVLYLELKQAAEALGVTDIPDLPA